MSPESLVLFARSAVLAACIGTVAVYCMGAASRRGEGAAGAAVRLMTTLVAPATALAFAGVFFWPIALAASVVVAVLQGRGSIPQLIERAGATWSAMSQPTKIALLTLGVVIAFRAGAALSTPPHDGDSLMYHLPMTAALLQDKSMWFTRASLYPGAAELSEAIGGAAARTVNGATIIQWAELWVLLLAAYGWARRAGASRDGAAATAIVAGAIPIVGDLIFISQNDLIVCAMLACGCALWRPVPRLAALALGLVVAAKVTGFLLVPAVAAVMFAFEGWPFSLADIAWAVALAVPWYVRTAVLTGAPVYSVSSMGWSTTIASNFTHSWWWSLTAIRNFGGLTAVGGGIALALTASRHWRPAFARALPWLALAAYVAWILMPNTAESVHGTLDQIRSGWSIRYSLLLPFVLATSLPIVLDAVRKMPLAGFVALIAAANAVVRSADETATHEPGAFAYALPVAMAAVCVIMVLAARRPAWRYALLTCAVVVWSLTATAGAESMRRNWNAAYLQWHPLIPPSDAILDQNITGYPKAAVLGMRSFSFVGPDFSRRVYEHEVISSPATWLRELRRNGVPILIAAESSGSPDEPGFLRPLPEETMIASAHGVCLQAADGVVRVYSLVAARGSRCLSSQRQSR